MYQYCIGQESEGYDNFAAELDSSKNNNWPWLGGVLQDAIRKWSKRGSRQDEMVAYELHRQIDAYLDILYISHQPGYNAAQMDRCYGEWNRSSIDWTMVRYCYKRANGAD
jgi:hypothetical protein